ncbi:aminodeoxychorismate synthase component I [Sphingomonas sp. HF-S4]|uniref:Probable branched-chain-amino-acid aminotransferase n=1 Tax=Sphingomonas agrestis TaxID=3080540 RepID=A0ABU3YBB1_9SPHN|nr:aminodeoxychorismate synthase component I [Sphingomonas sp. HF-S4]MDV3458552.1 aminodeoxychorismate synthase component I [Sphingomonas sp. HF-S4]
MALPDTPFVLLDDARPGGGARLFHAPQGVVRADTPEDVQRAFAQMRLWFDHGFHLAGFCSYEAAPGIEPHAAARRGEGPCMWFGIFPRVERVDVESLLPDPAGAWAGTPAPRITAAAYRSQFERVAEYIAAGDIYQANLTFRADVPFAGHPAALYALIRRRAAAGHSALVFTGSQWVLSFSPELFFDYNEDKDGITVRPMKGTAPRGATPGEDDAIAAALAADPKQRAENLMIVDLMRNDLARLARPGTVKVPALFEVERYPTVHQMVSTVTAYPGGESGPIDVLEGLFTCGSVTGAPKLRAMQVIAEIEHGPRGVYTGAIGAIGADGDAHFNVAIRTLTIDQGATSAVLGLGSGVVADSDPEQEWQECLAKGAFVAAGERPFDLIETMRFDSVEGMPLLERHLSRMKDSASALGFAFDRHSVRNELQAATFRLRAASKVRLLLGPSGAIAIGISPLPAAPEAPVHVAIRPLEVAPDDFRLAHKTSRRSFYDRPRAASGAWEVVFTDSGGFLTEGSFTSIFVERGGKLLTPPRARGLLPGVLRAELIDSGQAVEHDLRPDDLAGGFLLGNALRGLVAAVTVAERADAAL